MTLNATTAAGGKCDAGATALLIIDIQQRLGDAMPSKVLNRVLQNASLLSSAAATLDVPVIQTEQYPRGLGPTHEQVAQALPKGTQCIEKMSFSCCRDEGFASALKQIDRPQLVLSGMEAHVCVLQTALDLHAAGREVFVVEDAICSRRLENYQNALDRLRQHGISVVSAESVVFEWLSGADHPHFKAVQAMLR